MGKIRIHNGNWTNSQSITVKEGEEITIEAKAESGYKFTGWYEGSRKIGENELQKIKINQNTEIKARYEVEKKTTTGKIIVKSEIAMSSVYINNIFHGFTPLQEEILPGTYDVEIRTSRSAPYLEEITISSGEIKNITSTINHISPEMVLVNGGTFQMGNTRNDIESWSNEKPVHTVKLTYDYYIGRNEVTFEEYDRYCEDTGKSYPKDKGWGRGKRPVINVSWYDATRYCNWLSKKEGIAEAYDSEGNLLDSSGRITTDITKVKGYRLPTEAEWEFAARGGNESTYDYKYSGSNRLDDVGWYKQNSNNQTHPVGQKKPNELGLYDMSGNVWEWCCGSYLAYSKKEITNPVKCDDINRKFDRGGSFYQDDHLSRVSRRGAYHHYKDYYGYWLGFRIARTAFSY